jgi:hypothetical protein
MAELLRTLSKELPPVLVSSLTFHLSWNISDVDKVTPWPLTWYRYCWGGKGHTQVNSFTGIINYGMRNRISGFLCHVYDKSFTLRSITSLAYSLLVPGNRPNCVGSLRLLYTCINTLWAYEPVTDIGLCIFMQRKCRVLIQNLDRKIEGDFVM